MDFVYQQAQVYWYCYCFYLAFECEKLASPAAALRQKQHVTHCSILTSSVFLRTSNTHDDGVGMESGKLGKIGESPCSAIFPLESRALDL